MNDQSEIRDAIIQLDEAWSRLAHEVNAGVRGHRCAVPPVQALLLRILDYRGEQRMSDLAALLDMSVGGCTTLVDRALEEELVERVRDVADRRVVWVRLSEKGAGVLAEMRQARAAILARHFSTWAPVDVHKLIELSHDVAARILAERQAGDPQRRKTPAG